MREHLYKAKRLDTGKLVFGDLICSDEKAYILTAADKFYMVVSVSQHLGCRGIEVDPSTVCEFTGLLDKNGKKIFENDIVNGSWPYATRGVVIWDYFRCGFYVVPTDGLKKAGTDREYKMNSCKLEVIGSIHDKPEE